MAISQNFPIESPTLSLNFAGSKVLDPRVSFVRTTSGTYLDDNGRIVTAPAGSPRFDHRWIERTNLFTYSEDFTDSSWLKANATISSNVTATTAPDGTSTADKLVENSSTGNKEVYKALGTVNSGISYTISIYAKAAERTLVRLAMDTSRFASATNAYFDLSSGTVTLTTGGVVSASITQAGNGWYRCSATMLPTSSGPSSAYITLIESGTISGYTGNGTSGIYIWGAQFEIGTPVSDYIPTIASVISRSTIESLGLLIEEQRSNILRYSEDFSQTGVNNWDIGQATNTRSSNATLAPDGNTTADKLIEGTSSSGAFTFYQPNTVSGSGNVCFSCFLKASERRYVGLDVWDGNTIAASAIFDLQTGLYLSSGSTGGGSISVVSYGITPYPNGWYRCHLVANRSSITYLYSRISIGATNPFSSYTGTGTSGIFVWGAQLEVGSFPTSYIPTSASAVTRTADDARMTGTNFSSWYNQSLGTIVCTAKYTPGNTTAQTAWSMYNGSIGAVRQMFNGIPGVVEQDRGLLQNEVPTGTYTVSINSGITASRDNLVKVACAFQTDNFAISQDGSAPVTDTSGATSNQINLFLGATVDNTWFLNGHLCQLVYYPVRVSNSLLQILSR